MSNIASLQLTNFQKKGLSVFELKLRNVQLIVHRLVIFKKLFFKSFVLFA